MAGIESYSIGAEITLNYQDLTSQLDRIADQFGGIGGSVDRINTGLQTMRDLVSGISGQMGGLTSGFSGAADAASRAAAGATPGAPSGGSGGGAGGGGGYLPYSTNGDTDQPRLDFSGGSLGQLTTIPGQGRSTNGDGGYRPGDAEDVPFSAGGGGMPPINLNGSGGGQSGGFDPMHAMSYVFMGQAVTGMVSGAVKGLATPSFDAQTAETNIGNMVPRGGDIAGVQAQAMVAATKIQQANPGMTIGQALAMIGNLYSVDRNMDAVSALAPAYARDGYINGHAQGGADANDEMYQLLRSSEDMGKLNLLNKDGSIDTSKATSFMDLYTRMIANSYGNLSGSGALTMIGQAGPGATQMNDMAIQRMIVAAQALGPSQVGTGINAMYQEFIGGKMSQATARSLYEDGVLPKYAMVNGKEVEMFDDDNRITKPFKYGIGQVMLPPGTLKDESEALHDPIGWARDHLFNQYLNADGSVKTGDEKQVESLVAALNRDFSRIPGMRLAGNAVFNEVVQSRQIANSNNLLSLDQLHNADANTASSQAAGVGAAINANLIQLVNPLLPNLTAVLSDVRNVLNHATGFEASYPHATGLIDEAGSVLAGWGILKGASFIPGAIGRGAGAAAGFVHDAALGPFGILVAAIQGAIAAGRQDNALDAKMHPNNPLYNQPLFGPKPKLSPSGALHVVIDSAPGTPMPSSPTTPAPHTSMPMPGQASAP